MFTLPAGVAREIAREMGYLTPDTAAVVAKHAPDEVVVLKDVQGVRRCVLAKFLLKAADRMGDLLDSVYLPAGSDLYQWITRFHGTDETRRIQNSGLQTSR